MANSRRKLVILIHLEKELEKALNISPAFVRIDKVKDMTNLFFVSIFQYYMHLLC